MKRSIFTRRKRLTKVDKINQSVLMVDVMCRVGMANKKDTVSNLFKIDDADNSVK